MASVLTGVCALVVLLLTFGWWVRRTRAAAAGPEATAGPPLVRDLEPTDHPQLRAELCRQGVTPYGQGGAVLLLPVLAWQLYPNDARTVYDRSRDLDLGLLGLLDAGVDVHDLHAVLRDVRRRLLLERMRGGSMRSAVTRAQSARLEQVSKAIFALSP